MDIIVDVDEVVADIFDHLRFAFFRATNKVVARADWNTFRLGELYDIPEYDAIEILAKRVDFSALPIINGAKDAIKRLKDSGANIHMCTSRGFLDDPVGLTSDWLTSKGVAFDSVLVPDFKLDKVKRGIKCSPKSSSYKDMGITFDLIVDDYHGNLNDALASGCVKQTALITAMHNRKHRSEHPRYASLSHCVDTFLS